MVAVLACSAAPTLAGSISSTSGSDPLLDGAKGSCADLAAGADYAAGTDADGHPVVPADVADGKVPLPDSIAVPLPGGGRNPAYVSIDGRKLAPLLNPPSCQR